MMRRSVMIDDTRLVFEQCGTGLSLLLVHGFPFDRTMWARQTAELSKCRRIVPDLRGFGDSTLGSEQVSMARYADDLVGLLDALEIEAAVVCGLSMGGYIAFEMVRRHPARVRALVLMDTRAEADSPEGRQGRDEMAALAESDGMRPIAERLMPRLLSPESAEGRPKVVRQVERMILGAPTEGVVAALRAMRDRSDASGWLGQIAVPTLVVAGAEDQLIPVEVAESMARRIDGARCVLVPAAGHVPPVERPHMTNQLLRGFLREME